MITENELLNEQIKFSGMSDEEFLASEINAWKGSKERSMMITSREYYKGNQDILKRKRTAIGKDGYEEEVTNIPNNIVVDNRFARILDQKKNYILGKPITIRCNDDTYFTEINGLFGVSFQKIMKIAGEESLIGGLSYLYIYIDEFERLKFKCFPAYEICPFWKDSAHTSLECVARVYEVVKYEGKEKKNVTMVDLYRQTGVTYYEMDGDKLIQTGKEMPYVSVKGKEYNFNALPIIPIKANSMEIPLLSRVKELQDALNLVLSDFVNNMEENVRNSIIVLKNYDGTDLGEFRKNLSSYGAIKTRTQEGASGGVDVLRIEVNAENYKTVCDMLIRAITQNARGFDSISEKNSSNPNQLNIRSMYSDIDLDANDMESELQVAFEDILSFVNVYLALIKSYDATGKTAEIIFNRDILINETEAIENCVRSMGILSGETIVAQHPWISDVQSELNNLKQMSLNVSNTQ